MNRPDLTGVDDAVKTYIETLEAELETLRQQLDLTAPAKTAPALEPAEPPTTLNVITVSRAGLAKRTPRHFYTRQRRGGMGIFDLEIPEEDSPANLVIADESQDLLLITTHARAFRLPVSGLPESPIRSRGHSLLADLELFPGEKLALVLPHQTQGYLAVVTAQGQVRRLRYHFFSDNMSPGHVLYDLKKLGPPAAACWTTGSSDLFIATRQGRAIRFDEQQVPTLGCLGLRLTDGDAVVSVTGVDPAGGVLLVTADGQGAIRLMSGFSANKSPGASGKTALKTGHLIGATAVDETADVFIISRLSKIIRFQAAEIPPKEGVVQGVNCMALRADETTAIAVT